MLKFYTFLLFYFFYFSAQSQTVDFTFVNSNGSNSFCNPATINFTPVCTGDPIGFTWYFGNNQTSNSAIPSFTFATGSYPVKLVAVFQNVALEITKTIVISPNISASLSANKTSFCKPDTVTFTCTTNATNPTFLYNFGDGSIPVSSNTNTIKHFYNNFDIFNATVTVTSSGGCADAAAILIDIEKISLECVASPSTGCAPLTTLFSCITTIPASSTVSNYTWTFGDGIINSSGGSSTSHIYQDSGSFLPKIKVTTTEGCTDSFAFQPIKVGKIPTMVNAYSDKVVYCGSETPIFVGSSNFANEYKWEYGDNAVEIISDTIVTHKYLTLGTKIVRVTPYYNGCAGTSRTFIINVVGVITNYNYSNTCTEKKKFKFINSSQMLPGGEVVYTWNFGDNSNAVNDINPTHTFPPVGAYYVKLKAFENTTGCSDSIGYVIFTANPTLTNSDSFLCKNAQTTFNILNNYTSFLFTTWNTLGQISVTNGINDQTVDANNFGNFNSHLAIIDIGQQYCKDTVRLDKLISVRGPNISFNTGTSFCTNNNFIINNTSIPYSSSDTIKNWKWTFGIAGLTDTAYQPRPFIYSSEGTYEIKLIGKDKKSCTDTLRKNILVKESPFLRIFPRTQSICEATNVTLTAYHTDTLLWTPANLVSCATCDTTIASANVTTTIYAIASNAAGCSLIDSSIIKVFSPFIATATPNTFFACKNDTVTIKGILPLHKKILWSTSYGLNNTNTYAPIATILTDTTYAVLLTDSANCYNSTVNVMVKENPPATVDAGADRILSYNSPFTISPLYSPNITTYQWNPAGNLNCTNCPNPTGIADKSQTFIIKATTAKMCVAKDSINIFVECAYANIFMASAFNPINNGNNKFYFPQTRGIKKINRFSIYNRFGEIVFDIKNAIPNIRGLGWNGKYKGILQESNGFIYVLEATCEQGELLMKQGTFLLIR